MSLLLPEHIMRLVIPDPVACSFTLYCPRPYLWWKTWGPGYSLALGPVSPYFFGLRKSDSKVAEPMVL